ncbi:DUF3501 family protein [Limobrevibacterium gyesilva]|uniref:DUF3501 family protein n=1 Tax=Limobrevibacterium gyesilva TaxID=2991712 RepID=A0AA42CI43_9PROT|nr:DUF3501 family protein [Limobrevibacterium gyesilva]MCW3475577.1 DUF3501 family protein [Limobrevibacterium gyesilva]
MANKHLIDTSDILPIDEYARTRAEWRRTMTAIKRRRRIEVGPHVTFYFESWRTMWHQIHEMLFIERGGAGQVPDELAAYNPLVPQGRDLSATFMIEIDDPDRRKRILGRLGGVEETAFLRFGAHDVKGDPEQDQDRTTAEGKASSVQFVHFHFTPEQIAAFRTPGTPVILGLSHPQYGHMAAMPEDVRAELATDFD